MVVTNSWPKGPAIGASSANRRATWRAGGPWGICLWDLRPSNPGSSPWRCHWPAPKKSGAPGWWAPRQSPSGPEELSREHRRRLRWQRAPLNEPTPPAGSKTTRLPAPRPGQLFEAFRGRPHRVAPSCFYRPGIRVLIDLWAWCCPGCSSRVTTGGWLARFPRTTGTGYRSSACPVQPQRKARARRASVHSVYGSRTTAS